MLEITYILCYLGDIKNLLISSKIRKKGFSFNPNNILWGWYTNAIYAKCPSWRLMKFCSPITALMSPLSAWIIAEALTQALYLTWYKSNDLEGWLTSVSALLFLRKLCSKYYSIVFLKINVADSLGTSFKHHFQHTIGK